jgi:hypothetical protein
MLLEVQETCNQDQPRARCHHMTVWKLRMKVRLALLDTPYDYTFHNSGFSTQDLRSENSALTHRMSIFWLLASFF